MGKRRGAATALAVAAMVLLAAGCGGDGGASDGPAGTGQGSAPKEGGTYRLGAESFEWTGNFDPTGEYLRTALGIYSNVLVRTLVGYKHVEGAEGNELLPDLAADMPEVSEDGLTYTFTLREGVKFSPPVDREVTSRDVAYALERIGTQSLVAQYGFYYNVIDGMAEFTEAGGLGKTGNKISGVATPDEKTIVFTLTEPTGDFL